MGDLLSMDDRIHVGSMNVVLNLIPIRTRYFRSSIGIGGGFAAIQEVIQGEKFDSTGSQIVAQGALTFFSPSFRLGVKAIWLKTRFSRGNVPIVNEAHDVGSGLYYLAGCSFEFPL